MTNAELTILSLLAERPCHGYEIERLIEERGMREWTEIGFSSIYYVLGRLEKERLVESVVEERVGKGPNRRLFRVTPAGREAWQAAVYRALSVPEPVHSPFMLGLANLPGLTTDKVLTALTAYRQRLAERLIHIAGERQRQRSTAPDFVDALFDRSEALIHAELTWLDRFIARQKEVAVMPAPVDLTKLHKEAYKAKGEPSLVTVPGGIFLAIDGQGEPKGDRFNETLGTLYAVAYTLKFKWKALGQEYKVGPLEGLWFGGAEWRSISREEWTWRLLIRVPDFVTAESVSEAIADVIRKKKLALAESVRLTSFDEGLCAQLLHTGSYADEAPNIDRLHAFIEASGYEPHLYHHEIYLSDATKTAPEKLQTILRHPVKKREG